MFGGKKKLFRKKVKNLSKSPHFTVYIFHLILVGILSVLILSIKNMGEGRGGVQGRGLLTGQNTLSMRKGIC